MGFCSLFVGCLPNPSVYPPSILELQKVTRREIAERSSSDPFDWSPSGRPATDRPGILGTWTFPVTSSGLNSDHFKTISRPIK